MVIGMLDDLLIRKDVQKMFNDICNSECYFNKKMNKSIEYQSYTDIEQIVFLFYDALCMYEQDLIIPHIEVAKRDFVLAPLTELNPYLEHPVWHKSIVELYENLQKQEGYEKNII